MANILSLEKDAIKFDYQEMTISFKLANPRIEDINGQKQTITHIIASQERLSEMVENGQWDPTFTRTDKLKIETAHVTMLLTNL